MSDKRLLNALTGVFIIVLLSLNAGCTLFNDDSNKSNGFVESPIWIGNDKLLMLVENRTWIYQSASFDGTASYYLDYQYPSLYQYNMGAESGPVVLADFDDSKSSSYNYHSLTFCDYEQSRLFCRFYDKMAEMNMTDYSISGNYFCSSGDMNDDCTKLATILHDSFLVIFDVATQRELFIDTILTDGRFYYIKYDWTNGNYAVGFPYQGYYYDEKILYCHDAQNDTTIVFFRNASYFESAITFRDICSISFVPGSNYSAIEIELEGYIGGETESRRFIYRYDVDNIANGFLDLNVKGIVSPDNKKYAYYDETYLVITDNEGNEIQRIKIFKKTSPDL